jgi:hypothetical protein
MIPLKLWNCDRTILDMMLKALLVLIYIIIEIVIEQLPVYDVEYTTSLLKWWLLFLVAVYVSKWNYYLLHHFLFASQYLILLYISTTSFSSLAFFLNVWRYVRLLACSTSKEDLLPSVVLVLLMLLDFEELFPLVLMQIIFLNFVSMLFRIYEIFI